ncbi:MAG: ribosome-associated translation inhibitor RaiA [Candidatus Uhrbacteria bacterium]|nr:ribosome-associated translation inhibitor RaiA [Candidatus Uhrbacteria bacterium]MDP3793776.1 ribosome-associated translation inhibitor RaiA [Candidatus Uhrbacteria bacterium]
MTLNISHHGIELTPAIKQYVEEKMESLKKYFDSIRHIDVEVGISNHHHRKGNIFECKTVVQVGGEVIRMEKEADDLYKAIDKVRDHLRAELSDWKKRLEERSMQKGKRAL